MGKKYVIELEDEPFVRKSCLHGEEGLYRAVGFNSLVFDKTGLSKLTPLDDAVREAKRIGQDEAWRLARKIDASAYLVDKGYERGLTNEEIDEIYGDIEYIYNLSCEQALEKYRAWERKIDGKEV